MYDGMMAETITIQGHNGDDIEAYLSRPLGPGPYPGVVVIHHMPGYDRESKEVARTFGVRGYTTIAPNLFHRYAPGAKWADAAAAAREAGGVPDEQCLGDVAGAIHYLRTQPNSNGKVGVIGYCSGGRQTYLVACTLDVDAAVDCYGGRVVASPEELSPQHPVAPIDLTPKLGCPMLGLFGVEDANPTPEHVARMEEELKAHGKTYEFHNYENAGHAFFSVDRPSFRLDAAKDGWKQIWKWFGQYLATD
jgi:carboxymethylenebutenolidase